MAISEIVLSIFLAVSTPATAPNWQRTYDIEQEIHTTPDTRYMGTTYYVDSFDAVPKCRLETLGNGHNVIITMNEWKVETKTTMHEYDNNDTLTIKRDDFTSTPVKLYVSDPRTNKFEKVELNTAERDKLFSLFTCVPNKVDKSQKLKL